MTDLATYIGILIGIVGIVVAIWKNRQKTQLEQVIRSNNWFSYQRSNNATGNIQLAIKLYKDKHIENINAEVLEQLAKADAFGQEVFKESVRQIHFSEPSFTKSDFERWKAEGKITEKAEGLFLQLTTDAKLEKDVTNQ